MEDPLFADQDYELWWVMDLTRRLMHRARLRELSHYGLTPEHSAVLHIVQILGTRATPAEISRQFFRRSHSVNELLSRMEKGGFVRRVKIPGRKNYVIIELTEKGLEGYQQACERESIHQILSCLSDEERQELRLVFRKIKDETVKYLGV